jgi:hypothetical protein
MVAQVQVQRETASRKTSSGLHWGINHVQADDESETTKTEFMVTGPEKNILGQCGEADRCLRHFLDRCFRFAPHEAKTANCSVHLSRY